MGGALLYRTPTVLVVLALVAPAVLFLAPAAAVPTQTYTVASTAFAPRTLNASATQLSLSDEFFTGGISIGHSVPFYGTNEPTFWISSNGFITLHGPTSNGCCEGRPFPSRDGPNEGVFAGFWTDLDPGAGGTIKFQNLPANNSTRVLVVEFNNIPLKADLAKLQSFQMHAYSTGVLEVHWTNVSAAGVAMTSVGVENPRGSVGTEFERSANVTHTNEAIRFTPAILDLPAPPPSVNAVSPPAGPVGARVTIFGDDFQPGVNVTFGGTNATTNFLFSQQIETFVPVLPNGFFEVNVTNPDGGTATFGFEVTDPPPAPIIDALVPNPAQVGDQVEIRGSNFRFDPCCPSLTVGGVGVGFSMSSSLVTFIVPDVPSPALVEFRNGDGTIAQATLLLEAPPEGLQILNVSPSLVPQGGVIRVTGSGFEPDSVVLAGDRALNTTFVSSTRLNAVVDDLVAPGRHDVTVLVDGHALTLPGAIVVRGFADLVVESLEVARPTIGTDGTSIPSDAAAPQRVTVTIANRGAERMTSGGHVVLTWREADDAFDPLARAASNGTRFADLAIGALSPGEVLTLTTTWQRRFSAGEFVIRAEASIHALDERRLSNNVLETRAFVGVNGVRAVTPCDVQPILGGCAPTPALIETRTTTTSEVFAEDEFRNTRFDFDLRTATASFNFDEPDRIFDTRTESNGTSTTCTVWRFFGGSGSMQVSANDFDWLAGTVSLRTATNASAQGIAFHRNTTSTFVAGVEVDRTESTNEANVTVPRGQYARGSTRDVFVNAFDLRGDFSRCTIDDGESLVERFVFADLPALLEQPQPSFSGSGFAGGLFVSYSLVDVRSTSSSSTLQPSLGVLA